MTISIGIPPQATAVDGTARARVLATMLTCRIRRMNGELITADKHCGDSIFLQIVSGLIRAEDGMQISAARLGGDHLLFIWRADP